MKESPKRPRLFFGSNTTTTLLVKSCVIKTHHQTLEKRFVSGALFSSRTVHYFLVSDTEQCTCSDQHLHVSPCRFRLVRFSLVLVWLCVVLPFSSVLVPCRRLFSFVVVLCVCVLVVSLCCVCILWLLLLPCCCTFFSFLSACLSTLEITVLDKRRYPFFSQQTLVMTHCMLRFEPIVKHIFHKNCMVSHLRTLLMSLFHQQQSRFAIRHSREALDPILEHGEIKKHRVCGRSALWNKS